MYPRSWIALFFSSAIFKKLVKALEIYVLSDTTTMEIGNVLFYNAEDNNYRDK